MRERPILCPSAHEGVKERVVALDQRGARCSIGTASATPGESPRAARKSATQSASRKPSTSQAGCGLNGDGRTAPEHDTEKYLSFAVDVIFSTYERAAQKVGRCASLKIGRGFAQTALATLLTSGCEAVAGWALAFGRSPSRKIDGR